jgi:hypothetical protein
MVEAVAITSAEGLYDLLADDSIIPGLLGTVALGGTSSQGLMVASDSDAIEGISKATGVVAVIQRDPQASSAPFLNGDAMIERLFLIRLLQFPASSISLRAVTERILMLLPGTNAVPLGGPSAIAGAGQMVLHLPPNPVAMVEPKAVVPDPPPEPDPEPDPTPDPPPEPDPVPPP